MKPVPVKQLIICCIALLLCGCVDCGLFQCPRVLLWLAYYGALGKLRQNALHCH